MRRRSLGYEEQEIISVAVSFARDDPSRKPNSNRTTGPKISLHNCSSVSHTKSRCVTFSVSGSRARYLIDTNNLNDSDF